MAIGFSSLAKAEPFVFHQNWVDHQGYARYLDLSVDEDRVRQALTNGRDLYNYQNIFSEIINQAKIMSLQLSTRDAKVVVTKREGKGLGYSLDYEYREGHVEEAKAIANRVQVFIDGAYDDLKTVSYYRQDKELNALLINYDDIVGDFRDIFIAVDSYFKQSDIGKTDLQKINDRLIFLQSIPYDDMLRSDFELNTPIRMLAENRGDCESKQVFMAGLLRQLFPHRDIELVTLLDKEHIVLALEMPELDSRLTYAKYGRRYAILDATGPGNSTVESSEAVRIQHDFDYGKKVWNQITQ